MANGGINDTLGIVQHPPYKTAQRVKIETPIGAIEADTGSHILDGTIVVVIILLLYAGKKMIDRYFKK